MKIAFLDIETKDLNADNGIGFILCASMKLAGKNKIHTVRIDENPDYKKKLYNDTACVDGIAKWMHKVDPDYLVHYNGDFFDIPYINTRLVGAGKRPLPSTYKSLDHWKTARYSLKLRKFSLNVLAEHLGVEHHKTYYEPTIWQQAAYGHKPSLDKIVHHCELDVLVLEEVHDRVMPLLRKLKGLY